MAKGLKIGDFVTAREEIRLRRKSDGYKNGIKRLKAGDLGQIVEMAEGRSVLVDFNGKRVTLASQRLDKADAPAPIVAEQAGAEAQVAAPAEQAGEPRKRGTAALVDYNNPHFITEVANVLLKGNGLDAEPETIVVQVKLSDLPKDVQDNVRNLIQAKLDLGPSASPKPVTRRPRKQATPKPPTPTGKRRGRRAKTTVQE